jgi:hypothetical protein
MKRFGPSWHLSRALEKGRNEMKDRPISETAIAVQLLASEARAMLADLKRGWLWALLTQQRPRKPNESDIDLTR